MHVFEMKKEDFEKVPARSDTSEELGKFDSLVIIPQDYVHESGWKCMDFVAIDKEGEPICRLSGGSDMLNLDGIGGYGKWQSDMLPRSIEPKGWVIDCLPCGYLRLFSRKTMTVGAALSNFEVYAE